MGNVDVAPDDLPRSRNLARRRPDRPTGEREEDLPEPGRRLGTGLSPGCSGRGWLRRQDVPVGTEPRVELVTRHRQPVARNVGIPLERLGQDTTDARAGPVVQRVALRHDQADSPAGIAELPTRM